MHVYRKGISLPEKFGSNVPNEHQQDYIQTIYKMDGMSFD